MPLIISVSIIIYTKIIVIILKIKTLFLYNQEKNLYWALGNSFLMN